jgi:hypothetical protein
MVLVILLGLMIGALYHDRYRARPQSRGAYDKVNGLLREELGKAGKATAGPADVQSLLKATPSGKVDEEHYAIESYRWRRGLIFLTYDVHVVYRKDRGGNAVVYQVMLNEWPGPIDLPGGPPEAPPELKAEPATEPESSRETPQQE